MRHGTLWTIAALIVLASMDVGLCDGWYGGVDSIEQELHWFAEGMGSPIHSAEWDGQGYPFGHELTDGEAVRMAITMPVTSRGHKGDVCDLDV